MQGTHKERILDYLWSILPDWATNGQIRDATGIRSHQRRKPRKATEIIYSFEAYWSLAYSGRCWVAVPCYLAAASVFLGSRRCRCWYERTLLCDDLLGSFRSLSLFSTPQRVVVSGMMTATSSIEQLSSSWISR